MLACLLACLLASEKLIQDFVLNELRLLALDFGSDRALPDIGVLKDFGSDGALTDICVLNELASEKLNRDRRFE